MRKYSNYNPLYFFNKCYKFMKIKIFFIISLCLFLCACEKEDFLWTLKPLIPRISSIQKPELCNNILSVSAKIDHNGGSKILEKGFCYSTTKNPTKDNNPVKIEDENELLVANLSLNPNLVYYIRAFATNKVGTSYGKEEEIKTPSSFITLLTNNATNILNKTAKITGKIINNGSSIIENGFYLSLELDKPGTKIIANPNINGDFSLDLTNLISGRTYYYFAFANLGRCIIEGEKKSFTTLATSCPPKIRTDSATNISHNSAIFSGNVLSDEGFIVTERGFAWATTSFPNIIQNNKTVPSTGSSGVGSFSESVNNLSQNTRYYYRAYAINSCGTTYSSEEKSFTTKNCSISVTTNAATNISFNSVTFGGIITSGNIPPILRRGVVWDTKSMPDISLSTKIEIGSGSGTFNANITNLNANTRYFYRAYATNSCGTYYGNEISFTTNSCSVTIATNSATNITFNSATAGAIITNANVEITARGVVWDTKTAPNANLLNTKSTNGIGIGTFTSNLLNLLPNTRYFYRAYANTNKCGTLYGPEKSFTTLSNTLGKPTLIEPINNFIVDCCYFYLSWSCVPNAIRYEIQISTDLNFSNRDIYRLPCAPGGGLSANSLMQDLDVIPLCGENTSSCLLSTGSSSSIGIYYWRVRAKNTTIVGPWSNSGKFVYNY